MDAIDFFLDYGFAQRALVVGVAVATLCSLMSVVIVLKRLAFAGHGLPHAAFGGVGLAVFLGLSAVWYDLVIFVFSLGAALAIGKVSRRHQVEHDSAVGILLVVGMAVGVLLVGLRRSLQSEAWFVAWLGRSSSMPSMESVLFGSVYDVTAARMWTAVAVCAGVLVVAAALFKEIVFFTFDEQASRVFGVPAAWLHYLLMVLLAATIVLGMRLVGVLLLTALLVIPGATALLLSDRLGRVMLWSWVVGVVGMVGGLFLSVAADLYAGPCIAVVLAGLFAAAYLWRSLRAGRA